MGAQSPSKLTCGLLDKVTVWVWSLVFRITASDKVHDPVASLIQGMRMHWQTLVETTLTLLKCNFWLSESTSRNLS